MQNGDSVTFISRYLQCLPDYVEFCETDSNGNMTWYTLRSLEENRTQVTLEYYIARKFPSTLWFRLARKRATERSLERSMQNLGAVIAGIRLLDDPVDGTVAIENR
jgi:hypothetical protein